MRTVYDWTEDADNIAAAEQLGRLVGTEGWNVLRQLAERHFDVKISQVEKGTPEELAKLKGRAEGVQALFLDVQRVLKQGAAALAKRGEQPVERHAKPVEGLEQPAEERPRRTTPVVAMPGAGRIE